MSQFSDAFKEALNNWVGGDVIDYNERIEYGGYCSTCAYEEIVVDIRYRDWKTGKVREHTHYGNLVSILKELISEE